MSNPTSDDESSSPADFYKPGMFCRDNSLGYQMRRVVQALVHSVDHSLSERGLTHAQWGPLFLIHRREATTLAALSRELNTDPGALTRTLDRLEAKGLCRRERSAEDRRVVNLHLTPEGEQAIADVPQVFCNVTNQLLTGFTHDEWLTLMGMLRRIVANADALRDAPADTVDKPSQS